MKKHKCHCGKMAVWVYLPGFLNDANPYSCDDCVIHPDNKIGCSCNWNYGLEQEGLPTDKPDGIENKDWRWVEYEGDEYIGPITKEDGYWIYLDERGRPQPCVEYHYSEDGFKKETFIDKMLFEIRHYWCLLKYKARKFFRKIW